MSEKYSDLSIREDKIKKIKEIGFKEIKEHKLKLLEHIRLEKEFIDKVNNSEMEIIDEMIEEYFFIAELEKYLKEEFSFKEYEMINTKYDVVVWKIPTKTIDIWLENGVVKQFLSYHFRETIDKNNSIFKDSSFGYKSDFISIFESILYDEKHKGNNKTKD